VSDAPCVSESSPTAGRGGARRLRGSGFDLESWVLVSAAVAGGGWLRFSHLGTNELEIDEAVTWKAASAPTLAEVVRIHEQKNPGKLALHEAILHGWMAIFGQGEVSMRALSALLGTIAIALVFFAARELLLLANGSETEANSRRNATRIAAFTAVISAASLVLIRYSREARMYALMLAMILAQAGFFVRGLRRGGWANSAAVAAFTAFAIASNFTASLAFIAEAAWLGWYAIARTVTGGAARRRVWQAAAALAAGVLILAPFASSVAQLSARIHRGVLTWIPPPGLLDPLQAFESASGGWVFAALAVLAVWGVAAGWRTRRDAIVFALVWMWLPPLSLLAGSYLLFPMDVTRYVLPSFIPFFLLAAIGISAIGGKRTQAALVAALAVLMVARVISYDRKPRDVQMREAVAFAAETTAVGEKFGVADFGGVPDTALYYLPPSRRADMVPVSPRGPAPQGPSAVRVIVIPTYQPPAQIAPLRSDYPRLLGTFRSVEVRSR